MFMKTILNWIFILAFCLVVSSITFAEGMWQENGVVICKAVDDQRFMKLISDNSGGAIIVWWDLRDNATSDYDIYAQKINSLGIEI